MDRPLRRTADCHGSLELPLPPADAFPLFTPEGERLWVDGWAPSYPGGGTPEPGEGLAFEVGKAEGASLWIVTRFDPESTAASYVCTVPGHRVSLIDVDIEEDGEDASRVRVRYRVTALSREADPWVEDFERRYDDFLQEWAGAIDRHLRRP